MAAGCSDVLEGANELRLMLCKEKRNAATGAVGQSIVAACGACPLVRIFSILILSS